MASLSRRDLLKVLGAGTVAAGIDQPDAEALPFRQAVAGVVAGHLTGAEAVVEALIAEGCQCVYGIPGAQENELWDAMKSKHLPYLLVTHEFSASCMADGYARSTGKPGVLCVVPGPGLTNSLTGLGEALLDSVPIVCIVGDVAHEGPQARPFQVHSLNQVALLQPVTKQVIAVTQVGEIAQAVRQAMQCACSGEPGPVGVVIPYNLLMQRAHFNSGPLPLPALPCNDGACQRALQLLSDRRLRVGIYAGMGCMNFSGPLVRLAEIMQAPVATSISGKGCFPENHPLSVGWGYGPQAKRTAEEVFKHVDVVLALGVKYSEVSTGYYSQPERRYQIHVDINENNLGRVMRTNVCVHSDMGIFLSQALEREGDICRPANPRLVNFIERERQSEVHQQDQNYARCGIDPMDFIVNLRRLTCPDALFFVDVTVSQYHATEAFSVCQPRTFFAPSNNQSMGWSIPASLGAQRVFPGRQTLALTGDGCFLMSAMEMTTAARENLPVKFFILDDQAYHYMQELQRPAYMRTTATILARLDYRALACGFGVGYQEIRCHDELDAKIRSTLEHPGPVLTRVVTDYRRRPIRWLSAARSHFVRDLSNEQKRRFLVRASTRALDPHPLND